MNIGPHDDSIELGNGLLVMLTLLMNHSWKVGCHCNDLIWKQLIRLCLVFHDIINIWNSSTFTWYWCITAYIHVITQIYHNLKLPYKDGVESEIGYFFWYKRRYSVLKEMQNIGNISAYIWKAKCNLSTQKTNISLMFLSKTLLLKTGVNRHFWSSVLCTFRVYWKSFLEIVIFIKSHV